MNDLLRFVEQFPINDMDPRIKARLAQDSDDRKASVNDVAVGILAEHFGVAFEPAGGLPKARSKKARSIALRMPSELYWKIDGAGKTKKAVVERVLCEHYGIEYRPPAPRKRRRQTAAA